MFKEIEYQELINEDLSNSIFIDVRSPKEFEKDTIPNAINIPILDNEERISVGSTYKNVSTEEARILGIEIVSKKLPRFYEEITSLKKDYKNLIFFCSRGGYRSSSIVALLQSLGHKNIWKLKGGYKDYRAYVRNHLEEELKDLSFITLYGNTGSGKTLILEELRKRGMDVIDLEGAANHRGSMLGGVGLAEQNSQKKFESIIFDKLRNRKTNYIFIEGESRKIGKIIIPEALFKAFKHEGTAIKINTSIEDRLDIILAEYINGHNEDIIESLEHFRDFLGNDKVDEYIDNVNSNNFRFVARDLMINYYDPMYEKNNNIYYKEFFNSSIEETASDLIEWLEIEKEESGLQI